MADQSGHRFSLRKIIGYIIGPLLFLYIILFLDLEPGQITEIIPLAITALLPVVLFPLLGIMSGKQVSATYFNHVIFLFIGGFLIALAMQRWNLHKRIALKILMITGTSPAISLDVDIQHGHNHDDASYCTLYNQETGGAC